MEIRLRSFPRTVSDLFRNKISRNKISLLFHAPPLSFWLFMCTVPRISYFCIGPEIELIDLRQAFDNWRILWDQPTGFGRGDAGLWFLEERWIKNNFTIDEKEIKKSLGKVN